MRPSSIMTPSIPINNGAQTIWPAYGQSTTITSQSKNNQINEKRLASLNKKTLELNQRKQLVQAALKNFANNQLPASDSVLTKAKHIIFEDDENPIATTSMVKNDRTNLVRTKKYLFSENDDPLTMPNDEQMSIKPEFKGRKGEKLLKLSLETHHDQRFALDDKFVDTSESEGEEAMTPYYNSAKSQREPVGEAPPLEFLDPPEDITVDEELALYQRALQSATSKLYARAESPVDLESMEDYVPRLNGHTYPETYDGGARQDPKQLSKANNGIRAKPCPAIIQRFDPTRPDHVEQFEIKKVEKVKPDPAENVKRKKTRTIVAKNDEERGSKVEKVIREEEKAPTVDDKKYYTIYSDLKNAFASTTPASNFTLLQAKSDDLSPKTNSEPPAEDDSSSLSFKVDKSLESHFCEEERFITTPTETEDKPRFDQDGYNFFIASDVFINPDSNLNRSVGNFCSGKLAPAYADGQAWELKRRELSHLFKTKRKRYLRHKNFSSRSQRNFKGPRRN